MEIAISMQTIYEDIFVDVREALCGCAKCVRAQPVHPTFDAALTYVAREEHVARLGIYCKQLVPIHFIAVKLTTTLLRARGMDIADVRHPLEFPVDGLAEQLRVQFPDPRQIIFDIRVLEVVRELMHESPEKMNGNKPVGLSCVTPIDYFQDIRPNLVMYADVLLAAYEAVASVTPAPGQKLATVNATIHVQKGMEAYLMPRGHASPVESAAAAAAVAGAAESIDELAELIRQIELEEKSKRPSPKGKKKQNPKKAVRAPPMVATEAHPPTVVAEKVCVVCMDAHVAVAINACGHVVLCEDCYERTDLKRCPVCQQGECMGTAVWPQADERPPGCKKCASVFPNLRCACGTMTCEPCGPCKCKKGKARKLFWVG
jgi:hypothetical protein